MKKLLLPLAALATAATVSATATSQITDGFPSTLPDGVLGYELVSSASDIAAGQQYIIRAGFPTTCTNAPDALLTNVNETIDGNTVSVAEFLPLSNFSGNDMSQILWTAEASGDSSRPWMFVNNGQYFSSHHGTSVTTNVIQGGTESSPLYNLVHGIYTVSEPSAYTYFSFADASQTDTRDDITNVFQISGAIDSESSIIKLGILYNSNTGNYEYGAFSATFYGYSWTYNSCQYYITQYFSLYRVSTVASELALLKTKYKAQLSADTLFGVKLGDADACAEKIDDLTATTADELATAEAEMQKIVSDYNSAISQAITDYGFNGKYFTMKASGNGCYLKNNGVNVTNDENRDLYAVWKIVDLTWNGSEYNIKLYSPTYETYLGSLTSWQQNVVMPVESDPDNAVAYSAIPINGNYALSTTAFTDGSGRTCIHVNNGVSSIQGKACYWSYTGSDNSQWIISPIGEDEIRQIIRDDAENIANYFSGKLNHYTTTVENIPTLVAEMEDETKSTDELCATYHTNHAAAWSGTSSLVMPKAGSYFRIKGADGYITADESTHETTPTAASIIWYSGETMVNYANGYAFNGDGFCDEDDVTAGNNTTANISFSETTAADDEGRYIITPDGGTAYNSKGVTLEEVTELPVALNDGVAAVCFPVDVTLPEGGDFFTCTCDGTNITVSKKEAGATIAAGTAILVSGSTDVKIPYTAGASTAAADEADHNITFNQLATKFTAEDGYITYVPAAATAAKAPALRVASEDGETVPAVTFAKIADGSIAAANTPAINISESAVPAGSQAVETFSMSLDPEQTEDDVFSVVSVVTSIEEINADAAAEQQIYDLQGRRVNGNPTHGIFIFGNKIRRI